MRLVLTLAAAGVVLAVLPQTAPPAHGADKAALRASIDKSMVLLDKAQARFEKQATCASCHNQVQPMIAAAAMKAKGLPIDQAVYQRQVDSAAEVIRSRHDYSLAHSFGGGAHIVTGELMAGLADVKFPADENTDVAALYLMGKQLPNGTWPSVAVRFPHSETPFDVTAYAARAIDAYAPPVARKDADAAIAKARDWTVATPATIDNESMTFRLQALISTKAPAGEIAKARTALARTQKPDGGWSQRPGMDSDAYAASNTLVALHAAGMKPSDPVYQKGLEYLLKTQAADGSWHVKARALAIQPPLDAGFPGGPDQWISAWATGYAVQAMTYAL